MGRRANHSENNVWRDTRSIQKRLQENLSITDVSVDTRTMYRGNRSVRNRRRDHVLEPIASARRAVQREYEEVEAECRAFEDCHERVTGLETVSATDARNHAALSRPHRLTPRSPGVEDVRRAFRETVLSVDHYDRVYDESLVEHVRAELSVDLATSLRPESNPLFTDLYKQRLLDSLERAVQARERFCSQLETELASLRTHGDTLDSLLAASEASGGRVRCESDTGERLDEIGRARQETLQGYTPLSRTDGHSLCLYLYQDHDWTYPVLSAVARCHSSLA